MLLAIRRASSLLSNLAAERRPDAAAFDDPKFASAAGARVDLARYGWRGDTDSDRGAGLLARQNGMAI
jgi:hypothetical protein